MLQAIEGIYRNGVIQLIETPQGISESRVIVTFLETKSAPKIEQLLCFGMFAGPNQSTQDDFQLAEFQREAQYGRL